MAGFVLTFGPKSALCCLKRPRSATRQPPAPFLRRCNAWMDLPASDERQMCAGHSGCSSQFFAPGPFCSPHALETPPQSHIRRYPSRECFSPAQRALSRAFDRCMAARASHCAPPPKSMNECCGLRTFTVARVMIKITQSQFIKDKRLHVNTRNIQRQLYPCTATEEVD